MVNKEWLKALDELRRAQANFDNADPDYIDIAIRDLQIAEMKVDNLKRKEVLKCS